MRVLLAEDDPMIGEAIEGALKDASYATDWVKHGQTALTALESQHYDLVLLDPNNTRSLVYQLMAIEELIGLLPALTEDEIPERPLREARSILRPLESLTIDQIAGDELQEIETRLLGLSDAISERYFLQYEKSDRAERDNFLA